jgi:DedD protein
MNSLTDTDDDAMRSEDRELTLGTGMILGIFFGLVVLCGLVFGLGYKMGAHKPFPVAQNADAAAGPSADFGGFKPAAGSPLGSATSAPAAKTVTAAPVSGGGGEGRSTLPTVSAAVREQPAAVAPAGPAATPVAGPAAGAAGFVVQIAAVSHQEDAELLVNALRAKGYPVSAHTEPQDKFFHIQVGPFSDRKDAEAAKQRLIGDGYQPIVK